MAGAAGGVDPGPRTLRELTWLAAGRWDAESSAVGAVVAAMLGGRGRKPPANPFRPAAVKAAPAGPDQAAVMRDVKWALFEEGLRDVARKSARLKASQGVPDDAARPGRTDAACPGTPGGPCPPPS